MQWQVCVYIYRVLHSQIYPGKYDDRPPQVNLLGRRVNFSLFRFTWVKLTMNPPSITLKQKLEMVYSFTFYAALYICCHFMCCVIWSWASGQVSHAFLSIANFCQFLYYVIIIIIIIMLLLLLLCITPQHLYVVVVVYYTTTTMTTTRFIEIDDEVFVK